MNELIQHIESLSCLRHAAIHMSHHTENRLSSEIQDELSFLKNQIIVENSTKKLLFIFFVMVLHNLFSEIEDFCEERVAAAGGVFLTVEEIAGVGGNTTVQGGIIIFLFSLCLKYSQQPE